MVSPLVFDPSFEQPAADEADVFRALNATLQGIAETTWKDYGHAVRSVHAKSHGLLQGEMRVPAGLPEPLAQGMFAQAGSYPVILRFSTNPGDILDDSVSTPRGLAVKIIGVVGDRLPGSEAAVTQDIVMANAPAFSAATPKQFLRTLRLLAGTTDTPQVLKQALSAVLRGAEGALEAVGGESATLKGLGGHPATHILGETFYTMAPLLYGRYVAKLSLAPVSPELVALHDAKVTLSGRPDALREAVAAFFADHAGEWELRAQLCTDLATMPIEDASVPWPEAASPYRAVARITVPPQPSWTAARAAAVDDGLAFSPWHGLAAHRPLGGIMRSRKVAYDLSAATRAARNRCPIREPHRLDRLPV